MTWYPGVMRGPTILLLSCAACGNPLDLCPPTEGRVGFFSRGDCALTDTSFFRGHEWLTFFGNRDLDVQDRFPSDEVDIIVEGNRRVDWPKELLVHLNDGVAAYITALNEFTDRPENQRFHFLLTATNTSPEAAFDSQVAIREATFSAFDAWQQDRLVALTLVGRANHILQDSFSPAHSVRTRDHPMVPWCVVKVKAYAPRAHGHDTPDIEFHGGRADGDRVGHTTSADSLYREGRDCHDPDTAEEVEGCLSIFAQRARLATRDYLAMMRRVFQADPTAFNIDDMVEAELTEFFEEHVSLCP
jgi:hypothetical protein